MDDEPTTSIGGHPLDSCKDLLRQAFMQLDWRQLHGIVPLVCQQWYQLYLDCCSTMEVQLKTAADAHSLVCWIARHPSLLEDLKIKVGSACGTPNSDALLQSLSSMTKLRSLSIGVDHRDASRLTITSIPNLPVLTELVLCNINLPSSTLSTVSQLSQLRSLSLLACTPVGHLTMSRSASGTPSHHFLRPVTSKLTCLTKLDLSHSTGFSKEDLSHLTGISSLQNLRMAGVSFLMEDLPANVPVELPLTAIAIKLPSEVKLQPRRDSARRRTYDPAAFGTEWLGPMLASKLITVELSALPARYSYSGTHESLVFAELFTALCASGPQLQSLTLQAVVAPQAMMDLATLTQLTRLDIDGMVDWSSGDLGGPPSQLSALIGLQYLALCDSPQSSYMEVLASSLKQLTMLVCASRAHEEVKAAFGGRIIRTSFIDRSNLERQPSLMQFKLSAVP